MDQFASLTCTSIKNFSLMFIYVYVYLCPYIHIVKVCATYKML